MEGPNLQFCCYMDLTVRYMCGLSLRRDRVGRTFASLKGQYEDDERCLMQLGKPSGDKGQRAYLYFCRQFLQTIKV